MRGERRISHSVTVPAPPQAVFDLLADPRRHPELDGSGSVRGLVKGPERLALGSRFRMGMHLRVPYLITNEVVEFEEGRRIAWRHFGRHIWRWELEPVEGGTRVTETFDWSTSVSPRALELMRMPGLNDRGIRRTLAGLQQRFT